MKQQPATCRFCGNTRNRAAPYGKRLYSKAFFLVVYLMDLSGGAIRVSKIKDMRPEQCRTHACQNLSGILAHHSVKTQRVPPSCR